LFHQDPVCGGDQGRWRRRVMSYSQTSSNELERVHIKGIPLTYNTPRAQQYSSTPRAPRISPVQVQERPQYSSIPRTPRISPGQVQVPFVQAYGQLHLLLRMGKAIRDYTAHLLPLQRRTCVPPSLMLGFNTHVIVHRPQLLTSLDKSAQ
jgi:hypothetical protein